ncbi:MAG TPA: hypothetical protein GXX18_09385 [Bacillales bacterium]|nr:hypothetical protein [Bacillales bacterium]
MIPQNLKNLSGSIYTQEDIDEREHIIEIADDLIDKIIGNKPVNELRRDEKVEMIRFMEQKGTFLIRGTIDKVVEKLNIPKVTVYSYMDEIKGRK